MRTTRRLPIGITARMLFVAAVTCYLLARVFAGGAAPLETMVDGGTAACGLEFLLTSWRELWERG